MSLTTYDPQSSMRDARARYFAVNHFGDTGGYDDAWVDFQLGPIPFPFPNTKGRVEAVRFHDLHHILTGYDTDFRGELEISAWEIGAGCKHFGAAWVLNLAGLAGGVVFAPRRTVRAFLRGLRSESFYGQSLDELLDLTVAEARARMRVDQEAEAPSARALGSFVAAAAAGTVIGLAFLGAGVILAPVGLVTNALRKRGLADDATSARTPAA